MAIDSPDGGGWQVVKSVRNPWGQVPLTAGGKHLPEHAREYMDRLLSQHRADDPVSRRHHYVPRSYLSEWSSDGKRVWTLNTVTGAVKEIGLKDVCVEEDFYRVVGSDGVPHNRVELLFGVVDDELRRVQRLFAHLEDPESLEFDDLLGLGVSMAVQRMRTLQERRLHRQYNRWDVAQNPVENQPLDSDDDNPYRLAGIHTELLFKSMWEAADVLTTRQVEVWHDPRGRFMTSDAPVMVPFEHKVRPSLLAAPYVIWPISPHRVVALSNDPTGDKAVMLKATAKLIDMMQLGNVQGRERMIFASEEQRDQLPEGKKFRRRTQVRLRCSDRTPSGEHIPPPGCCVEWSYAFAAGPDVVLCDQGLHSPAPEMWSLA